MVSAAKRGALVAFGLGLAAAGFAQPASPRAPTPAASSPATPGAARTPAEKLAEGERVVAAARDLRETLTTRIDAANRRSDIVMVDCLSPLLTQLEGSVVSAEQRLRALRQIATGGDVAAVNHEYTMLTVLGQRFDVLESDMNQCLGDGDISAGDDQVTVEVEVDLPDEDVTAPVPPPPTVVVPVVVPPISPVT